MPASAPAEWPYLTADLPPVPGRFRACYEDFRVDEIPLYEPDDAGDHTLFRIQKVGLPSHRAAVDVARALGRRPRDIGMAGLKDAHAVTTQWLSIEHVEPDAVLGLRLPRVRVLEARRHRRKLRVGHLRGNRFALRLREVGSGRVADVRAVLEALGRRGVPNYFGAQRFGTRGDTAEVGRALLGGEYAEAVALIAGRPAPADNGAVLEARAAFEAARYTESARLWPPAYGHCARLARAMARAGGDPRRALRALDRRMLRFYVQAYQSLVFNHVLARRIQEIDSLRDGDLAYVHASDSIVPVPHAADELSRARRGEISPTGPLFGPRMRQPAGEPARIEGAVLAELGSSPAHFETERPYRLAGARRQLRFVLGEADVAAGADEHGSFIELRFTLPPGSYATVLLREIGKGELREGPVERESSASRPRVGSFPTAKTRPPS